MPRLATSPALFSILAILSVAACDGAQPATGSSDDTAARPGPDGGDPGSSTGTLGRGDAGVGTPATCANGEHTTISGTVFDPAGRNPLYNVVAYVPKSAPEPLVDRATCDKCDALYSGHPIAATVSGADGKFVIKDAPDGVDVPVVLQVGKWRKQVVVPKVARCADTAMPKEMTTLPSKRGAGSDMPRIAMVTGGADTIECLLRRVGIDDSEFAPGPGGDQRVHIYQGVDQNGDHRAPFMPPHSASDLSLWSSSQALLAYDMVLMSCEGSEIEDNKPPSAIQALRDYVDQGGRVFTSHFHYYWFNHDSTLGTAASWSPGANHIGSITGDINTAFPKGADFKAWLGNVGALSNGGLPIQQAMHNADVSPGSTISEPWIRAPGSPTQAQYLTFNTPIGAAPSAQCGRVVYSDLHVGGASGDYGGSPVGGQFPSGCSSGELSPQEKALEFMLFDLSSCVTPDSQPPAPPPITVQ